MKAQLLFSAQGHTEAKEESRFFLAEELAVLGVSLAAQETAFDGRSASLRRLVQSCELTFWLFEDSEAPRVAAEAAACFGASLAEHEPSSLRLREFRKDEENAVPDGPVCVPQGSTVFGNAQGRYPGFSLSRYGQTLIVLPRSIGELIPLFAAGVIPYISRQTGKPVATHTVGVFGLTEAAVRRRLADVLGTANPLISLYASRGECLLRVTAKGASDEAAESLCRQMTDTVCERLESAVYGVDVNGLPTATVQLLRQQNKRIATAESCTAGLLSGMLTGVPGASSVFECGVAAYSCDIKHSVLHVPAEILETHGAVSPQTAGAMAEGVRAVSGADIGIGITGVAGPDSSEGKPVGTVYIALADDKRTWVKAVSGYESFDRDSVRQLAASSALDLARRYLEALPAVMAGGELRAESAAPRAEIPEAPPETVPAAERAKRQFSRIKKVALFTVLPLLLVFALVAGYLFFWTPLYNQWEFDRLQGLYETGGNATSNLAPNTDAYPEGTLPRFYSLYSENPDVRGWLNVNGLSVDYPVMGGTETDYSRYNFAKQISEYGVPYFGKTCQLDSPYAENRNLTVFGNNTGDGQMFSPLTSYLKADALLYASAVTLDTLYESRAYTVFAVMLTTGNPADPDYFDYTVNDFADNVAFASFVKELRRRSLFRCSAQPEETDELLLLSTDVSKELGIKNARLVVCSRLARPEDGETESSVTENRSVLVPQSWLPTLDGENIVHWLRDRLFQGNETSATTSQTAGTKPTVTEAEDEEEPETEPISDELLNEEESEESTTTTTEETAAVMATTATSTTTSKTTTTTKKSSTTAEKSTTTTSATTTEKPTTTTTKTTKKSSATTTKKTAAPAAPKGELQAGTVLEDEYMAYFRLKNKTTGKELKMSSPEDLQMGLFYLVKKELGSARSMQKSTEAQKAQAVASYTYVLKYCATNNKPYEFAFDSYSATDANDQKLYKAVGEVVGVKLVETDVDPLKSGFKKHLCDTMYFASSCGVTATSNKVYTGSLPYLKSVESAYDTAAHVRTYFGSSYQFKSTLTVTWDELLKKVANELEISLSALKYETKKGKMPLYAVSWDGGEGRYVYQTNLYYMDGKTKVYVKGHIVRKALGSNTLRSHAFEVTEYDEDSGKLTLSVTGWGHGVGLSQTGAVGYANEAGWTYDQILRHYYSVTDSSDHQLVAPKWS